MSKPNDTTIHGWREVICLFVVIGLVSSIRLPSLWYQKGSQDEQWFTVPGWTVACEGVPRIPYAPVEQNPASVFEGAHRTLYALPPAYFYLQAVFFLLLPAGYGTARLASWVSGSGLLILLYVLMRQLRIRPAIALLSVFVCAFSRAFYFPWQDSRPDMLCAMFGVAAINCIVRAIQCDSRKMAAMAGVFTGLGALSHPYALVFAIQIGILQLWSNLPVRTRILNCAVSGLTTLAAMTLWVPLILVDANSFWSQFSKNVLSRSGPGILSRLLWPWPSVSHHARLVYERAGALQTGVIAAVLSIAVLLVVQRMWKVRKRSKNDDTNGALVGTATMLLLSAVYLHLASVGMHPAKGYLCYPWAMVMLFVAALVDRFGFDTSAKEVSQRRLKFVVAVFVMLFAACLPGSGLRAAWTFATRNDDANYNRQQFCRNLNERFPPDARLLVSPEFVFEFELLGRRPVNASLMKMYQDVEGIPFDYLISSTQCLDEGVAESLHCELVWTDGDPNDPLACYAEVYVPGLDTLVSREWPRTLRSTGKGP